MLSELLSALTFLALFCHAQFAGPTTHDRERERDAALDAITSPDNLTNVRAFAKLQAMIREDAEPEWAVPIIAKSIELLNSKIVHSRRHGLLLLEQLNGKVVDVRPSLPALCQLIPLNSRDLGGFDSHHRLLVLLGKLGPDAAAATPALRALMSDEKPFRHTDAAATLLQIDAQAEDALDLLIAGLQSEKVLNRYIAAYGLARAAANSKKAVALLLKALDDPAPEVRVHAAAALWRIDRNAEAAVPVLLASLKAKGVAVPAYPLAMSDSTALTSQDFAALTLGEIDPSAEVSVPALRDALYRNAKGTDNGILHLAVVFALNKLALHSEHAEAALRDATTHSDSEVRKAAGKYLKELPQRRAALQK